MTSQNIAPDLHEILIYFDCHSFWLNRIISIKQKKKKKTFTWKTVNCIYSFNLLRKIKHIFGIELWYILKYCSRYSKKSIFKNNISCEKFPLLFTRTFWFWTQWPSCKFFQFKYLDYSHSEVYNSWNLVIKTTMMGTQVRSQKHIILTPEEDKRVFNVATSLTVKMRMLV